MAFFSQNFSPILWRVFQDAASYNAKNMVVVLETKFFQLKCEELKCSHLCFIKELIWCIIWSVDILNQGSECCIQSNNVSLMKNCFVSGSWIRYHCTCCIDPISNFFLSWLMLLLTLMFPWITPLHVNPSVHHLWLWILGAPYLLLDRGSVDCDSYRCAAAPQYLYYACMSKHGVTCTSAMPVFYQGATCCIACCCLFLANLNVGCFILIFACLLVILKLLCWWIDLMIGIIFNFIILKLMLNTKSSEHQFVFRVTFSLSWYPAEV